MKLTQPRLNKIEKNLLEWKFAKVVGQRELRLIEMGLELLEEVKRLNMRKK